MLWISLPVLTCHAEVMHLWIAFFISIIEVMHILIIFSILHILQDHWSLRKSAAEVVALIAVKFRLIVKIISY